MIWYDMRTHDMSCFVSYDCFDWYDVIHPYPHRSKDSPNWKFPCQGVWASIPRCPRTHLTGVGVYKCTWVLMTLGLWVSGIHYWDMILCYTWHIHQQHGANFFFYLVKAWGHLWVTFRAGWGEFWEGSGMCPKETPSLPGPIMPVKWQWSIQVLASQFPGPLLNKPSDPTLATVGFGYTMTKLIKHFYWLLQHLL